MVDVDLTAYRKKLDNKAVRRNVTLPNWLNVEADKSGINVLGLLQEAMDTICHFMRRMAPLFTE